ncbi:MAG: hypothetical protein SXA11_11690 [Cyanobacteriota bacterium]|nr:hypothetical protein [Cyanobacteriota bacterium]
MVIATSYCQRITTNRRDRKRSRSSKPLLPARNAPGRAMQSQWRVD